MAAVAATVAMDLGGGLVVKVAGVAVGATTGRGRVC